MSIKRLLKILEEFKSEISLHEKIFDALPCGIVEFLHSGDVTYVNETALKFFEQSRQDFVSQNLSAFFEDALTPADYKRLRTEFNLIIDGEKPQAKIVARFERKKPGSGGSWILQIFRTSESIDRLYLFVQPTIVAKPFSELEQESEYFDRILYQGRLIIMRTDDDFRITDLIGDTDGLFGMTVDEVLTRPTVWSDIMSPADFRRLSLKVRRLEKEPVAFKEEIRISPEGTSDPRWLMLQVVPVFNEQNDFVGWEGFGVDVTEKRQTEIALLSERKRIAALYELSRALQVNLAPEQVALKGLKALIQATGSDAGFCCFYEEKREKIEVIASDGLSERFLNEISVVLDSDQSIIRQVVRMNKGIIIPNIQKDRRAVKQVARREGLRSVVVMPLHNEDRVLGTMVIFGAQEDKFNQSDFDLIEAGAGQVAIAARQAEYYQAERRQADSLAVLYRLSHQLSRLFTPQEVAETAFALMQEEVSCRRLWLGVVNEQGTHIVGQSAIGPGMRESIQKLHIELDLTHDYLDTALRTRQPVIVPLRAEMECSGLNRLMKRLKTGTFVILPLVSLGQVVGVCFIEPNISSSNVIKRKLPLLSAMATEIATVLLARRFESKLADADKMRMASVLASGVAHNFNNLLQAVMGQASIIEMQLEKGSTLARAARTIVDAAEKGAGLVKHLLAFSTHGVVEKRTFAANQLLRDSKDFFLSMLGGNINFDMSVPDEKLMIQGDYNQLQQVLHYILVNAREAVSDRERGAVQIELHGVRLRSGEVTPELAPGSYVRIDVEDNGVGMTEDQMARCFEPFFSTKEVDASTGISLTGSGLGLSSAYSIVRQHGGSISISSTLDEGTIFSIYLPEFEQDTAERRSESRDDARVLIVDAKSSGSYSVRSTLESLGLDAYIEPDMEQAEHLLTKEGGAVQIVVLDLERAGEFATDFVETVQDLNPHVTFVCCTVERKKWSETFGGREKCLVIEKPLSVWAIQSVVRDLFPAMKQFSLEERVEVERYDSERHGDRRPKKDGGTDVLDEKKER